MRRMISFTVLALGATISAETTPPLLPMPQKIAWRDGCSSAAIRFAADKSIPAEGYRLDVAPDGIQVMSSDVAGRFYAEQTLRQLAAKDGYRCCVIEDAPAYSWRGLHFDDCRHFFGKEVVKRTLDLMAKYKFNVFHWHLTDDQGWRLQIDRYPRLTEVGAVRPTSPRKGVVPKGDDLTDLSVYDGKAYGPHFYAKDDVREIVAYAAERHIAVVPEIELPGHAKAALAAYPEFSCRGDALEPKTPWCKWGVSDDIYCAGNEGTVKFLENILDEVCELFPGEVVHIGGDEAPKKRWQSCPKCQAKIKALGLKDEQALQGWMVKHFTEYLAAKGKRVIGWDEILDCGTLPKNAMVQTWRGWRTAEDAVAAVTAGHDVVMSPNRICYLDYWQGLDPKVDPYDYIGAVTSVRTNGWVASRAVTLKTAFGFDPRTGIPAEMRAHVLGGQGNNWSEYTWAGDDLEWKMWPRALGLAEALWTADPKRDYDSFARRAEAHRAALKASGVNAAPVCPPPQEPLSSPSEPLTRAEKLRSLFLSGDTNYVFVASHRMDWRGHPENSLSGAKSAIAMGVDILELDPAITMDNRFVLLHDAKLERTTEGAGWAWDLMFDAIRSHRLRANMGGKDAPLTDERVASLDEVLMAAKDKCLVNIDKFAGQSGELLAEIRRLGMERQVICKSGASLDEIRDWTGEDWGRVDDGTVIYMPIVNPTKDEAKAREIVEGFRTSLRKPPAYEVCFRDEDPLTFFEWLRGLPERPRLWINTMWKHLNNGHTREQDENGDWTAGWDWFLAQGATALQTDRPAALVAYLTRIGRHDLDRAYAAAVAATPVAKEEKERSRAWWRGRRIHLPIEEGEYWWGAMTSAGSQMPFSADSPNFRRNRCAVRS